MGFISNFGKAIDLIRQDGFLHFIGPNGGVYWFLREVYLRNLAEEGYKAGFSLAMLFLPMLLYESIRLTDFNDKFMLIIPYKGNYASIDALGLQIESYAPSIFDSWHATDQHVEQMGDIYQMEGFVELEHSDGVVFDIGAYVGGFTRYAYNFGNADKIVAIDPFSTFNPCLNWNTTYMENLLILDCAVWNEPDEVNLNISKLPNDNSLIDTDDWDTGKSVNVLAKPIPSIAEEQKIEAIDFLKIEAEGVEPEIIEGLVESDEIEASKVVVNCGPERDGESPTEEVIELLESKGFVTKTEVTDYWGADIVYAKKL